MKKWNELDSKYKAAALTVVFCLLGACVLVAISMTFNWKLHKKSVDEFMASENTRTEQSIEQRIAECRANMERHAELNRVAATKRLEVVLEARHRLGDDWENKEIRSYIMYGRPPE